VGGVWGYKVTSFPLHSIHAEALNGIITIL